MGVPNSAGHAPTVMEGIGSPPMQRHAWTATRRSRPLSRRLRRSVAGTSPAHPVTKRTRSPHRPRFDATLATRAPGCSRRGRYASTAIAIAAIRRTTCAGLGTRPVRAAMNALRRPIRPKAPKTASDATSRIRRPLPRSPCNALGATRRRAQRGRSMPGTRHARDATSRIDSI
jgi:hypothetical protein